MLDNAQRKAAKKFVEYWTFRRGSEKGEDQQFWNSLLRDVLGVADVERCIQYQVPVPMGGTTKFLDAWIPETRILIEHKSRGIDLEAPQSGHGGLTPYEQAAEYDNARPFNEKARWIVTCNFDEFRIHDRAKPLAPPLTLKLRNLPKEAYRLAFLVNPKEKAIDRELEISVQAGSIVGEIYDALLKQYENKQTELLTPNGVRDYEKVSGVSREQIRLLESDHLAALNRLCVRLVFCLYAEDAEIFPKDCFRRLVEASDERRLRNDLLRLFQILDTPHDRRDPYLEPEFAVFPYTNGGLFRDADHIPPLTEAIRQLLIGASRFDWREITPTIFGALFESTLNPVTRRAGGMVYTSVENIHKVIDPLFLDDLTRRVNEAFSKQTDLLTPNGVRDSGNVNRVSGEQIRVLTKIDQAVLLALQEEMSSMTFLDPACGSGNFLTETYICLRRLENRIIAALQQGQGEFDLGISVKVSISQFRGIEINDFAVKVAKTALWIAEAQMLRETADILHREPDYLPLKDYDGIVEGNALRLDWPRADYIIGNPPFIGARLMSPEQKDDLETVFGKDWKGLGNLDYVAGWYKKAAEICSHGDTETQSKSQHENLRGSVPPCETRCALVSTNSVTQGDAVATLWKPLVGRGVSIDFAHRTFRWDSESNSKAHVQCVIIGFHSNEKCRIENEKLGSSDSSILHSAFSTLHSAKPIFDGERVSYVPHINAYLLPAPDVFVESRSRAISALLPLVFGSMPNDGGFLSDWSPERRAEVVARWPEAAPLFRRLTGSQEYINGIERWCLWLKGANPALIRAIPPVMEAVAAVRETRLASKRAATRKLAATPTLFGEIRQPESGNYLIIPSVSSERRRYVPIGFLPADVIASNLALIVPGASLYHFGVLASGVHMAWMRAVAGRLEMRYRYSAQIVYNNFPWPEAGDVAAAGIARTAQGILDARAKYPAATLADLYDELTMPSDLRRAHQENDRAVAAAYGLAPDTPEPEVVAHLFKLYTEVTRN